MRKVVSFQGQDPFNFLGHYTESWEHLSQERLAEAAVELQQVIESDRKESPCEMPVACERVFRRLLNEKKLRSDGPELSPKQRHLYLRAMRRVLSEVVVEGVRPYSVINRLYREWLDIPMGKSLVVNIATHHLRNLQRQFGVGSVEEKRELELIAMHIAKKPDTLLIEGIRHFSKAGNALDKERFLERIKTEDPITSEMTPLIRYAITTEAVLHSPEGNVFDQIPQTLDYMSKSPEFSGQNCEHLLCSMLLFRELGRLISVPKPPPPPLRELLQKYLDHLHDQSLFLTFSLEQFEREGQKLFGETFSLEDATAKTYFKDIDHFCTPIEAMAAQTFKHINPNSVEVRQYRLMCSFIGNARNDRILMQLRECLVSNTPPECIGLAYGSHHYNQMELGLLILQDSFNP